MDTDRLRTLANFLRNARIQREDFQMDNWISQDYMEKYLSAKEEGAPLSCNFAGCALGHATLIPEFEEAGLKLRVHAYVTHSWLVISYHNFTGEEAAIAFFGLTRYESSQLFMPTCYDVPPDEITPAMVADRIMEMIAEEEGE